MIRGFVLCLLVGSSYASFGTASCSSSFSLVPFCATATCTSTEKSYSKPMPATYAWGEDTDLPIDTATNAAALRVLRWKCSCDKYDDGTAADGDCTFQQYKLNSDGTTSTSETEFVQALGYYKFNVWAPPPRSGRNASATQARIYDLWSDHQATRAADMQVTTTEYRAQMEKKAKLRRSLTLLQESSKSAVEVGSCTDTPGWTNGASVDCAGYASSGWCVNGGVLIPAYDAFEFNWPGFNCCVCGGGVPTATCWSGTCEQRMWNTFNIGSDGSPGISSGTIYQATKMPDSELVGTIQRQYVNGDANPVNRNAQDQVYLVDFACPGNTGATNSQDKFCADWTIPTGCQMIDANDIRTKYVNLVERFKSLAGAQISSTCQPDITVGQYASSNGLPMSGEKSLNVNQFQVPFSQKYNAYYLTTAFFGISSDDAAKQIFRNAVQILKCNDGSVSSQVFAQPCHQEYDFGCNGQLTCEVVDSIWRKIVGEIHREIAVTHATEIHSEIAVPTPTPTHAPTPTPAPTPPATTSGSFTRMPGRL